MITDDMPTRPIRVVGRDPEVAVRTDPHAMPATPHNATPGRHRLYDDRDTTLLGDVLDALARAWRAMTGGDAR